MEHYVYIYLDPRKPGNYSFEEIVLNFRPFYVGIGKNNRDTSHLKEARDFYKYSILKRQRLNKYKICIIRCLERNGLKPIILRLSENLSREKAQELEIKLITHWGRKNNGTGFLSNMTPGGEHLNLKNKNTESFTKWWKLIDPNGKEYIIHGLTDICNKYSLSPSKLIQVANGKRNNHKGWNCYRIKNGIIIIKDKKLLTKEERYNEKFGKNVSKSLKGKRFSENHIKNLRKPKTGNTLTKTKEFMEGKKKGAEKRKGTKVLSITKNWQFISPDKIIYNVKGMKDICNKFNLTPSIISKISKTGKKYKNWQVYSLPANFFEFNKESII